ncbi:hypothetical protein [Helicobacter sp. 23-1045]
MNYENINNGKDFLQLNKNLRDEECEVIMDASPKSPLFTIAIPTYNRIDTLKEALDSAINQNIKIGGGQ